MSIQTVTPAVLETWPAEDYILIDVRDESAYQLGNIPGSIRIARQDLLDGRFQLPKTKKLVFYCMFGVLSKDPAEKLLDEGYDAYHLEGGYGDWLVRVMKSESGNLERRAEIEKSLRKRFKHDIMGRFVKAIIDYDLIRPNDKIAVCISGGKDSMLMAMLFKELKRRNKIPFEVVYLCMDPGYSETTLGMIQGNAGLLGIPLTMFRTRIFDAVDNIPKSPCYICARMRRGYLYRQAKDLGCNKIALGHHYDDVIETTLMSILYSGQTQTMMPKLHSTNFEGMELIRPLYLIREDDIKAWRDANGLQFIRCACHFTDTCSVDGHGGTGSKRLEAKRLIAQLKKTTPSVEGNIFRSMENICMNAVLGYKDHEGNRHTFLDTYDANSNPEKTSSAAPSDDVRAASRGKQKNSPF
ncbi:MAG: ATP-binding protein [Bilifractor sp.]|nr:ATPase [Lachnospiraceae bacterium]MDY2836374.1 ATP-binding protein [Bilifractor sp.]